MNSIYMTREGRARLEEELRLLKVEERPRIKRQIVEAREKGDLSENAEYDAAKEEQGRLETRIAKLQDQLSRAIVLEDQSLPEGKAHIGRQVEVEDLNTGKRYAYTLVSEAESDFVAGRISTGSPVGRGLVGHGAGEEVTVQVPAGTKRFRILGVKSPGEVN